MGYIKNLDFPITAPNGKVYRVEHKDIKNKVARWRWSESTIKERFSELVFKNGYVYTKNYQKEDSVPRSLLVDEHFGKTRTGKTDLTELFRVKNIFDNPKPLKLIKYLLNISMNKTDIILDFFAGSGTTEHAIIQLNAEDGGNRKFILCQIDEQIDEKKPAYQFCKDNNLQRVISSITIERLNRSGEKIKQEIEAINNKNGVSAEDKKQVPDIGFKVFDSVDAPKLEMEGTGILFPEIKNNPISRIYNMIFTVSIDEPSQVPEEIIKDCIYKLGKNYYITDSHKVSEEQLLNAIKDGSVYIDG